MIDASSGHFVGLHFICDMATLVACVVLATLIGRLVPRRFTARISLVFWALFAFALCLGGLQLAGVQLDLPSLPDLYAPAKVLIVVVVAASSFVLWRLLPHRNCIPYFLDLDAELEQQAAKRVQTEEEPQKCESELRTIFDNTPDVIVCVNIRGRMLAVNSRVEEVFGYTPEELIGKRFTKLGILQPKDILRIVRLFRNTTQQGKANEIVELDLRHKSGRNVSVEVGTRFVHRDGRITGIVSVFRDISERKQVMAALTAARNTAEAARQTQRELLAAL